MSVRLPAFSGLVAFYAAVRHGTLTGAAQELNVSQPAISRRISTLEADLGCHLFDRSRKPVQLTASYLPVRYTVALLTGIPPSSNGVVVQPA